MKALIAGSSGQLGRALQVSAPTGCTVIAPSESEFDITDERVVAQIMDAAAPTVVINAAAYTAVDRAESEIDAARRVNADAVGLLAAAARRCGAGFAHVSTDFVFDGSASTPYLPDAAARPLGVYGQTKMEGENNAREQHPAALIVRTAWVYAAQGQNFVRTMLRLMAERDEVHVVADQIGTPTHVATLATALWKLIGGNCSGVFHATDAGVASWYDFAVAIRDEGLAQGVLTRPVAVVPIRTVDYPTPAARPAYGVLDKTATWAITGPAPHWRHALRDCIASIARG